MTQLLHSLLCGSRGLTHSWHDHPANHEWHPIGTTSKRLSFSAESAMVVTVLCLLIAILSLVCALALVTRPAAKLATTSQPMSSVISAGSPAGTPAGDEVTRRPAAAAQETKPPETTPHPQSRILRGVGVAGTPYGMGMVDIVCGASEPLELFTDEVIRLEDPQQRILGTVVRRVTSQATKGPEGMQSSFPTHVQVRFLFRGEEPLNLALWSPRGSLGSVRINVDQNPGHWETLRTSWWHEFQRQEFQEPTNQLVHQASCQILATRLGLPRTPSPQGETGRNEAEKLEHRFERTVSTLLGIDSFLLAMDAPDSRLSWQPEAHANLRLPAGVRMSAVPIPNFTPVEVEPIANVVPEDCFYVRCRNLAQYDWLRDFLMGWGGSLSEIVSNSSWDYQIRETVEAQLAISLRVSQQLRLDDSISDMAIIGTDLFFQDGAGVGVIFEAHNVAAVQKIIETQRQLAQSGTVGSTAQTVNYRNHLIHELLTPDNRLRSFYVRSGKYLLVTNCQAISRRFVDASLRDKSLGRLREFQFARSQSSDHSDSTIQLYLSDPFFRQAASPQFFLEARRRLRARHEITIAELASRFAASDGLPTAEPAQLQQAKYLPKGFGQRADNSRVVASVPRGFIDSLRGARGVFRPIADCWQKSATQTELDAYARFARSYSSQWQRVDPISIELSRLGELGSTPQQVSLAIHVTPYARARYDYFRRFLAPASERFEVTNDLMALSANMKSRDGRTRRLRIGLLDDTVPFEIQQGELKRSEPFANQSLAERNQYVLVESIGPETFDWVEDFLRQIDRDSVASPPQPRRRSAGGSAPVSVALAAFVLSGFANRIKEASKTSFIDDDGRSSVLSRSSEVRSEVLRRKTEQPTAQESLLHFQLRDLNQSQATRYIHAYAYLEARKRSAEMARLHEFVSHTLATSPDSAAQVLREVAGGQPFCPLGGEFIYGTAEMTHGWRSTAWLFPSVDQVSSIPPHYRHPFIEWLQELELTCRLDATTLSAEALLTLRPTTASPSTSGESTPAKTSRHEPPSRTNNDSPYLDALAPLPSAPEPGDELVVRAKLTTLRQEGKPGMKLAGGQTVVVLQVQGPWVGVYVSGAREIERGWIPQKDLGIPIK